MAPLIYTAAAKGMRAPSAASLPQAMRYVPCATPVPLPSRMDTMLIPASVCTSLTGSNLLTGGWMRTSLPPCAHTMSHRWSHLVCASRLALTQRHWSHLVCLLDRLARRPTPSGARVSAACVAIRGLATFRERQTRWCCRRRPPLCHRRAALVARPRTAAAAAAVERRCVPPLSPLPQCLPSTPAPSLRFTHCHPPQLLPAPSTPSLPAVRHADCIPGRAMCRDHRHNQWGPTCFRRPYAPRHRHCPPSL